MQRIALLFDNRPRPETTGLYVRRALGKVADVEHFLPDEFEALAAGHHGPFDLCLAVDDGLDYRFPECLRPLAFWAIDTHVSFERVLARARSCDHVFAAQRDGAERLRSAGVDSAVWLPLACDPALHRQHPVDRRYDVAFVGNVYPGPRAELLSRIRERFPNTFVGRRYLHEMAETYSAAKVVFNRSVANDINMRVFEALGCGSLLVTNDLAENGQDELFRHGEHLLTYRDADDLLDRIAWALDHEAESERIAAAGREEVLARHTYRHRVETLLKRIDDRRRPAVAVPAPISSPRDMGYFEFSRPEVLALIPASARQVLDIGCGAGRLGAALKARQPARVTGIELDPGAARTAAARLDEVLTGDIDGDAIDFPAGTFDCVVCADVLEHLRRPETLLAKIGRWLTPEGRLVASIPNVRHHSVVTSLLAGNFTYEAAGLLDETHLRFFTRREIEKLLFRAGFEAETLQSVPGPGDDAWWKNGGSGDVDIAGLRVSGLDPSRAREFFTYQYLVVARPRPARTDGLTSIVLVTHNQLDYTRICLDSIRRFTDEPYELIVVDNGSTDGTVPFLRSCADVRLIENTSNRGFPAAANQGIDAARGEQVLLLNNDTLVTTGWLRRMLDALRSDSRIGLVGPVSNNVSGPQQIPVAYTQLADLDGFAWDWGRNHAGQVQDLDRLVGFCLLIDRPVLDRIGLLDERFGIGNFEDDDYCRRALQVGFRCVVARDAFIHHFGGRTFAGSGIDFERLMAENERKYREKWAENGHAPPAANGPSTVESSAVRLPREAIPALSERPRLSLCMIVRDNERTIVPCLESIRPWVDELIVVDTGSTDRTPEICRQLGARVFHFPWCDSFSAARNESLKYAGGEWIFWMDSDDTIPADCGRRLRALADGPHATNILGYVMQVHCPSGDDAGDMTVVDHVKLFRNRPDLKFEFHIHEQILPAIRRAGGDVAFTDIHVVHSGSDHSPEGRRKKLDRDFRLLALDAAERPDHPFVLFNLGMTYADAGRHEEAIAALERCLAVSEAGESHARKAYAILVASLAQAGQEATADEMCRHGLELFPDDPELLFREGMLRHETGRLRQAEQSYRRLLNLDPDSDRFFTSRDAGLAGWKARHNLALVYEQLGDSFRAEEQWRKMTLDAPDYAAAWRGLAELLIELGRLTDAEQLPGQIAFREPLAPVARWIESRVALAKGDSSQALRILEAAADLHPRDEHLLRELCRLVFERSGPAAAQPWLDRLKGLVPDDPAVWHNLGVACLACGDAAGAGRAFRQSLRLRPNHAETTGLLSQTAT